MSIGGQIVKNMQADREYRKKYSFNLDTKRDQIGCLKPENKLISALVYVGDCIRGIYEYNR